MKAWRQILNDRVAGAGLLAVLVQLLLFQAVATSFTCSTMSTASIAQGPAVVICHGAGTEDRADASAPVHRGGPGGTCFDCPCAVSSVAGTATLATFAPGDDLGPAHTLIAEAEGLHPPRQTDGPFWPPLKLRPHPTGPPLLSA